MYHGVNSGVAQQKMCILVLEWHWQISWEKFMQLFSLKTIFEARVNEWMTNIQLSANNWNLPACAKMLPLTPTGNFPPKMGISTSALKNVVPSYCVWYHNVITMATVVQHAKFYQHHMKNVLVKHLGHGKMPLVWLYREWVKNFMFVEAW